MDMVKTSQEPEILSNQFNTRSERKDLLELARVSLAAQMSAQNISSNNQAQQMQQQPQPPTPAQLLQQTPEFQPQNQFPFALAASQSLAQLFTAAGGNPSSLFTNGAALPTPQQQLLWQQAIQTLASASTSGALVPNQQLLPNQQLPQLQPQQAFFNGPIAVAAGLSYPSMMTPTVNATIPPAPQADATPPVPEDSAKQAHTKRKTNGEQSAAKRKRQTEKTEADDLDGNSPGGSDNDDFESIGKKEIVDWDNMTPAEKRRHERNLREQQRSFRISQQIKDLREVLVESNVSFKPNKFSILASVSDYIKQLQARAIVMDVEQERLNKTIGQTNEFMRTGQLPAEVVVLEPSLESSSLSSAETTVAHLPAEQFHDTFQHCPYPLAVASLDGRMLACNGPFESIMDSKKEQIVNQSLFIFVRNHQEIFEAMADLLKRSSLASEAGEESEKSTACQSLSWCGEIVSALNTKLPFSITLTHSTEGNPKFFNLSIPIAR